MQDYEEGTVRAFELAQDVLEERRAMNDLELE